VLDNSDNRSFSYGASPMLIVSPLHIAELFQLTVADLASALVSRCSSRGVVYAWLTDPPIFLYHGQIILSTGRGL
jgi:hypothetical protein